MENCFLRKVEMRDKLLLFNWVNNEDSLKFKIRTRNKIDFSTHEKWFIERLKDDNTYIWIIEYGENSVGQIRFQYIQNYYDIDIYVLKNYRKLGIASKAIKEAEDKFRLRPLRAEVMKENKRSLTFFLRNGFKVNYKNENFVSLIKQ